MNKKQWLLISFVLIAINVFSQTEEMFILGQNDTIINTRKHVSHLKSSTFVLPYTSLLTLPFFDDFARPGIFPNQTFWADQNVYVNNTFCLLPPSINVATFDALGSNGLLYPDASSSEFSADTLTSQPFNLSNHPVGAVSENLYIKNSDGTYRRISDTCYYKSGNSYKLLRSAVYNYTSGDSLYQIATTDTVYTTKTDFTITHTYKTFVDSIYTQTPTGFVFLKGSDKVQNTIVPYSVSDSLYLSFWVQPGGVGDMPESGDSLRLECYAPLDVTGIFINEVDSAWIELYNATDSIVNIAGYYLFNDTLKNIKTRIDTSTKKVTYSDFQIPNDGSIETRIPPMGLLVINASDIHAIPNFDKKIVVLSRDSLMHQIVDSVYISDTTSRLIASFGRNPDGGTFDGNGALLTRSKNQLNGSWSILWEISSDSIKQTDFKRQIVALPVNYLKNGFRFRFINYASLSNDVSHARNEDQWNLDDVSLIAGRKSTYIEPDVCLRTVNATFYDGYTSIPFQHLININEESIQNYINYELLNTDTNARKVGMILNIKENDTYKQDITENFSNSMIDIQANSVTDSILNFNGLISLYDVFTQHANNQDKYQYGVFDFKMYITDDASPIHEEYRWNDTARFRQAFYNYYAYDDGSSEAGYGIRGAEGAQVAYKFTSYMKDTLNGVLMYFNNTLYSSSNPSFNLCVWDDNKGKPGKLLAKVNEDIKYAESINGFSLYPLEPSSIVDKTTTQLLIDSAQTFYVGWIQPTDILLNVGVDFNNTIKQKLFFNVGQYGWQESVETNNHPLMIRPVFDTNPLVLKVRDIAKQSGNLLIYPNPTAGICTIVIDEATDITSCDLSVRNVLGQELIHNKASKQIDVSAFSDGMYYVTVTISGSVIKTGKLIIHH